MAWLSEGHWWLIGRFVFFKFLFMIIGLIKRPSLSVGLTLMSPFNLEHFKCSDFFNFIRCFDLTFCVIVTPANVYRYLDFEVYVHVQIDFVCCDI